MDKKSKERIDPDLYIAEVRKMREENPDEIIKLDFFGGEPLIQFPIIQQVIEEFEPDDNIKFFMPTNGLLLTEEKLHYLKEHNVEISLSFDGLWQDTNRIQFTGNGTLTRYVDKKHLFKGLRCHTMITRGNYNLLENHLFIMDTLGINPEMTLVRDVDVWDHNSIEKLKVGITEIFDWYIDNPNQEIPYFVLFYLRHFLLYHSKGVEVGNCGAGTNLFSFSENKVVPCNRFKDSPEMLEKIPEFYSMPECQSCEVKNYCKKGCLFEQIKNNGPIVELCDIYKHTYKEVSKMVTKLKNNEHFARLVLEELENE
jgi:uncharacterized protein